MAPFQYTPFQNTLAPTIAEILAHQGDPYARAAEQSAAAQAQARQASGNVWGRAVEQVGQIPQQIQQQQRINADHAQRRQLQAQQIETGKAEATARTEAAARGAQQRLVTTVGTLAKGADSAEDFAARVTDLEHLGALPHDVAGHILEQAQSGDWSAVQKHYIDFAAQYAKTLNLGKGAKAVNEFSGETVGSNPEPAPPPRTRIVRTIENGVPVEKIVPDEAGASFPVPPPPTPEPKKYSVTVKGPDGQPITKLVTEEELARGIPAYREPKDAKEPQKFWIFRDGKPLRISEQEYRPGDLPSNTREQGRPVTSGDAGRVAEIDNSIDDIKRLGGAIAGSGDTGTVAQIGASMPNWVTNMTGWGTDAKKKQALIDRVKQVIGKALEGGVLRKEDELKYEKILPTIGDPNEVVTSKLAGLDTAIRTKRERLLESLTDAGYETSKFSRTEQPTPAPTIGTTRTVGADTLTWKTVNGQTGWYK